MDDNFSTFVSVDEWTWGWSCAGSTHYHVVGGRPGTADHHHLIRTYSTHARLHTLAPLRALVARRWMQHRTPHTPCAPHTLNLCATPRHTVGRGQRRNSELYPVAAHLGGGWNHYRTECGWWSDDITYQLGRLLLPLPRLATALLRTVVAFGTATTIPCRLAVLFVDDFHMADITTVIGQGR